MELTGSLRRRTGTALRVGLGVSLFVHVCLLTALFSSAHQPWYAGAASSVIQVDSGFSPAPAATGESATAVRVTATPQDVTGELVGEKIDQLVAQVQQLPQPQQLERLERIGKRLQRVSSEESLDQLAEKFEQWLGYQPRASQPLEQTNSAAFDFETAQLHDVLRDEHNPPRYTAVLLDAEGRTLRLPLSASEGRRTYELMQRIQANPMLERIYRRIAMPLLDQFIRAGQAAARLESDAAQRVAEQTVERVQ